MNRLRTSGGKFVDVKAEMMDLAANTSARVFLDTPLSKEGFCHQLKVSSLLTHMMVLGYVLPRHWFFV